MIPPATITGCREASQWCGTKKCFFSGEEKVKFEHKGLLEEKKMWESRNIYLRKNILRFTIYRFSMKCDQLV